MRSFRWLLIDCITLCNILGAEGIYGFCGIRWDGNRELRAFLVFGN